MTNQPINYPLPEGSFLTLPPDADFTINILKFTDLAGAPTKLSLTVLNLLRVKPLMSFMHCNKSECAC